jgi:hypothetical protein
MSQANYGRSTPDAQSKPSRRHALSILGAIPPTLAMGMAVAAPVSGETEVSRLYAKWLAAKNNLDLALTACEAADAKFASIKPALPSILEWDNAPSLWSSRVRPAPNAGYPILIDQARQMASGELGSPDQWTARVLKAAEQFDPARDTAWVLAGIPAAEEAIGDAFDAIEEASKAIIAATPTTLADVQMQIVAMKEHHERWQTATKEDSLLFDAILSAQSSFRATAI